MNIKEAQYITSVPSVNQCPNNNLAKEYAFIGRSNVGKSSLINMLTGRKGLAKTSQLPGKTLYINFFKVNNDWFMVDLPGYGYAARSKDQRIKLKKMIEGYVLFRSQMICLFVLLDVRHKPQKIDIEFMEWLGENGIPFSMVFTKSDKLSPTAVRKNIDFYKQTMLMHWEELPPIFITSSEDKRGRDELLGYIDELNKSESKESIE